MAAERVRLLEAEVELLERRLADAEQAGADALGGAAARAGELKRLREDSELWVSRGTAPLRVLERGVRWIGEKLARVGGMIGRRVAFRARR